MKSISLLGSFGQGNYGDEKLLEMFVSHLKDYRLYINKNSRFEYSNNTFAFLSQKNKKITTINDRSLRWIWILLTCDYCVFAGGSIFKELPRISGRRRYGMLTKVLVATIISRVGGAKIILSHIGVDRVETLLGNLLIRLIVFFVDTISVRDAYSYEYLSKLTNKTIHLVSDPVFCIHTPSIKKTPTDSPSILFNISRFDYQEESVWSRELDSIQALLTKLYDQKYSFKALAMQKEGFDSDVHLLTSINQSMNGIFDEILYSENWISYIQNSSLVIGKRYHILATALHYHIPTIAIVNEHKTAQLAVRYNIPVIAIDKEFIKQYPMLEYAIPTTISSLLCPTVPKPSTQQKTHNEDIVRSKNGFDIMINLLES